VNTFLASISFKLLLQIFNFSGIDSECEKEKFNNCIPLSFIVSDEGTAMVWIRVGCSSKVHLFGGSVPTSQRLLGGGWTFKRWGLVGGSGVTEAPVLEIKVVLVELWALQA
jgi:hypothetical protein